MAKITFSVDSTADYLRSELDEKGIKCIPMAHIVEGAPVYGVYSSAEELFDFYEMLDRGVMPSTTQLNTFELVEHFERLASECAGDIIHLSLSSGLSGTYACAVAAAAEVNQRLSERKIYAVDTLGATAPIYHILEPALKAAKEGAEAADIVRSMEHMRDRQQVWIVVNSLTHLRRGGRVSGPGAAIGTAMNIKPQIVFNSEGRLIVASKAIGLNKAYSTLIAAGRKYGVNMQEQEVVVVHTGRRTIELAQTIADMFRKEFGCKIVHRQIGPVIGTHVGPDGFAVVFSGKHRTHK